MTNIGFDFVLHHVDDEWDRLLSEVSKIPDGEYTWQPASRTHSMAWHLHHVVEWRYALVHVWISGQPAEEKLTCLGWESEPLVRAIAANPGDWHEPVSTVADDMKFAQRLRDITNSDMRALAPERWWTQVTFPWRTNRTLDEVFQDIRHSAVHRGQIRELRKLYRTT